MHDTYLMMLRSSIMKQSLLERTHFSYQIKYITRLEKYFNIKLRLIFLSEKYYEIF